MAVLRIVNHLTFAKFIHKFSVVGLNFKDIFYIGYEKLYQIIWNDDCFY
jgi:hypothetical protein